MVKMMTTEPSVELKLKKGGAVKMMNGGVMGGLAAAPAAVPARGGMMPAARPKKPGMAARRAAMMGRTMKEGGETAAEHKAEMSAIKSVDRKLSKHAEMAASKAHKGLKTGGVVMGQAGFKEGGVIKSTKGETKMVTAEGEHHTPKKTGEVVMGKPGGYKKGGKAMGGSCYAKGGGVEGNVSTTPPGKTNTTTGEVKKGNAGGYKKGGYAKKFADGGSVQADGRAVKMPQGQKKPSQPVSISRLSGTFKTGGKVTPAEGRLHSIHKAENAPAFKAAKSVDVDRYSKYQKAAKKMAAGGDPSHPSAAESKGYKQYYADEKAENEADREAAMGLITDPIGTMRKLPGKIREGFDALKKGMRGQGAVTTTEREVSRTVSPGKKRGGRAC